MMQKRELEEHNSRHNETQREYLDSVSLEDTEAPLAIDFLVHYAVQCQEKRNHPTQKQVVHPLNRLKYAVGLVPIF